jgi:hypothetical protein
MAIKLRLLQTYDASHEAEFMELERKFAALERQHKDFPKGRRYKPLSASLPVNTLVWEATFPTLNEAHQAINFFAGNEQHEELARQQRPFFKDVRMEFLEELSWPEASRKQRTCRSIERHD